MFFIVSIFIKVLLELVFNSFFVVLFYSIYVSLLYYNIYNYTMLAARHRSNKFVVVPYLVTATRCTLLVLRYSYIMYIVKKLCGSVVPLTLQYRDEHVCAWIFSIESLNFINTSPLAVLSIRC